MPDHITRALRKTNASLNDTLARMAEERRHEGQEVEPGERPDGIECRDETIRDLAARVASLDAERDAARAEAERLAEALRPLCDAAYGLSFGVDWNCGTNAKLYRQKLLDAIPAARAALAPEAK